MADRFGDYRCSNTEYEIDLVISFMYGGTLVGIFAMTAFGEVIGRKKFIVIGMGLIVAGTFVATVSGWLWMSAIGLCAAMVGIKIANYVCMSYTAEIVSEKYR